MTAVNVKAMASSIFMDHLAVQLFEQPAGGRAYEPDGAAMFASKWAAARRGFNRPD